MEPEMVASSASARMVEAMQALVGEQPLSGN